MHQGELARSPSLAQAEMIQRLNPVAVTTRPRPPKLTPTAASVRLHDNEERPDADGKKEQEVTKKRDSRIADTNDHDDTLKACEETATAAVGAADPALVKAAAATGTAQILETLRAREGLKWDFER